MWIILVLEKVILILLLLFLYIKIWMLTYYDINLLPPSAPHSVFRFLIGKSAEGGIYYNLINNKYGFSDKLNLDIFVKFWIIYKDLKSFDNIPPRPFSNLKRENVTMRGGEDCIILNSLILIIKIK